MYKIVAFDLIEREKELPQNIFSNFCQKIHFQNDKYHLQVFYLGDLPVSKKDGVCEIGDEKDLHNSNIFLKVTKEKIIIKNDWLGSIPIFYDKLNKRASTLINNLYDNQIICKDGLNIYLNTGYAACEITPLKGIGFLRYFSTLTFEGDTVNLSYGDDPALEKLEMPPLKSADVLDLIKETIEKNILKDTRLLVPLSGGYDSRLLTSLLIDSRLHANIETYTYGISYDQKNSFEVEIAKNIAQKLNVPNKQITIDNENNFLEEWNALKGISTHSHGMYQYEFYKKIHEKDDMRNTITISGIFGDVYSGKREESKLRSLQDYKNFFFSHGLCYSKSNFSKIESLDLYQRHYQNSSEQYKLKRSKFLLIVRNKMMLISYLMQIPQLFGSLSYSPFNNIDVVTAILRMEESEWRNRAWQKKYFISKKIDYEPKFNPLTRSNNLYLKSFKNSSLVPLDYIEGIAGLDDSYIKKLNEILKKKNIFLIYLEYIINAFKIEKILGIFGIKIKKIIHTSVMDYYHLYPIEKFIKEVKKR